MKQTTKRRSTTEVKDLATIWHTGLSLRRDWSSVDTIAVYIDSERTGREGPRSDRSHRLDDRWAKQSTRSPGFHFNLVSLNEFNDTARRTWVFGRQAALLSKFNAFGNHHCNFSYYCNEFSKICNRSSALYLCIYINKFNVSLVIN